MFCWQTGSADGSPPAAVSLQGPSTVAVFVGVKLGKEQEKQGAAHQLDVLAQPVTPLSCSFSLSKSCHVTCLQASGAGTCPCLGSLVMAPDGGKGSTRVLIDRELSLVFGLACWRRCSLLGRVPPSLEAVAGSRRKSRRLSRWTTLHAAAICTL